MTKQLASQQELWSSCEEGMESPVLQQDIS